ncbi:MAG: alpha/beta fold hydrolase [Alphaproteobacteria bacterium]|nr:alpha/beta fold hydrolase [Alphaproteobacteria bacterium]
MTPSLAIALLGLLACRHDGPAPDDAASSGSGPDDTFVQTADGASVHLRRYRAEGPPVLLVHGISSNHRAWDLDEQRSLARHLQARGMDAWLLDLRGHGLARVDADGHAQRAGWSIDTYGRQDLPAAIDHVRAETGAAQVGYVGHSLGGMVAAIYVAQYGDDALAALAVVGSPIDFGDPEPLLEAALIGAPAAGLLPTLPTPTLARAAAAFDRVPLGIDDLLFSPGSVDADARRAMYRSIVSPLSRGEVRQFRRILAEERFVSRDGLTDYVDSLTALDDAPLLVIAGRGDRVAPPDRVTAWIPAAASPDETLVVASRANGFATDYGHLDLTVGDAAAAEIHPLIGAWLAARLPAATAQADQGQQPEPQAP